MCVDITERVVGAVAGQDVISCFLLEIKRLMVLFGFVRCMVCCIGVYRPIRGIPYWIWPKPVPIQARYTRVMRIESDMVPDTENLGSMVMLMLFLCVWI